MCAQCENARSTAECKNAAYCNYGKNAAYCTYGKNAAYCNYGKIEMQYLMLRIKITVKKLSKNFRKTLRSPAQV